MVLSSSSARQSADAPPVNVRGTLLTACLVLQLLDKEHPEREIVLSNTKVAPATPALWFCLVWCALILPRHQEELRAFRGTRQEEKAGPNVVEFIFFGLCSQDSLRLLEAALIQGRYKIVTGHQGASGFWTGPIHPNGTGPADPERNATACS